MPPSRLVGLLRELPEVRDRSRCHVALHWLIQKNVVSVPGAKSSAQARHNTGALSFARSSSEIKDIEREAAAWRE
ncbi:aldo/keto reductase [Sorangium sp. So ce204]|uniref:aldo/keto reductase n=1 Tax=Sorangium sp. So ce204 TaxID=3133288 RepID=UPI003F62C144